MRVDETTLTDHSPADPTAVVATPGRRKHHRPKRRLRKLRILLILVAFGSLACISALFGMLTSVASDLPQVSITATPQSDTSSYSFMYDDTGKPIGVVVPPDDNLADSFGQISYWMRKAIVAVEDRRFWSDPGIDLRGLVRAFVSDVSGGQREGGSTIAEQLVKITNQYENRRTIFNKLREAALAFQLVHKWTRETILQDYLDQIYFGNGAVGIESAARIYFGAALGFDPSAPGSGRCGDPTPQNPSIPRCAQLLQPYQAALLAGMVANPTAFDPLLHPEAARIRRNTVLLDMLEQHDITRSYYEQHLNYPVPKAIQIEQPTEPSAAPYFTAWVRQQIVPALERSGVSSPALAQYEAYYGGLKIHLTINLALQQAAQQAVDDEFPPGSNGPTATLVAIDNRTGEVRAMVSGNSDFQQDPFNLAVDGYRQPGSSFKLFTLAAALSSGAFGPDSVIDSHPVSYKFIDRLGKTEVWQVRNFGDTYSGPISLATATAISDNSVFAQVGMSPSVGTPRIRTKAVAMGIRTPVSTNPSMILGGLSYGVSALDMAHAYETEATGGLKVFNPVLGDMSSRNGPGPIGIHSIDNCEPCNQPDIVNTPTRQRVLSPEVAAEIDELLTGVVAPGGTGGLAAIPGVAVAGKTGTTSNYVDAWFVGWTPQLTTAVWVGYPNSAVPMETQWQGKPVEGGTYPTVIWRNFMVQALQILAEQSGKATPIIAPLASPSLGTAITTTPTTSTTTTPGATTPKTTTTGRASTTGAAGNGAAAPTGNGSTRLGGAGSRGANPAGSAGAGAGGTGATPGGGASNGTPASSSTGTGSGSATGGAGLGG